jgi:hypothetical protein
MFETSLLAEYLRRNPGEVSDYVDFGPVLAWRRYHTLKGEKFKTMTPQQVKQIEDEYDNVKAKFITKSGKVRNNWTLKPLSEMAEELRRSDSYDLVYGVACSLHHANFEGLDGPPRGQRRKTGDARPAVICVDRCGSSRGTQEPVAGVSDAQRLLPTRPRCERAIGGYRVSESVEEQVT